jgi:uncharacterized protein with GYD domain
VNDSARPIRHCCPVARNTLRIGYSVETVSRRPQKGAFMPRFLFEASYTVEGVKGLRRQGGSGRREAVARAAQSVGGRLEHFYFAFGDHDAFAVADLPDNQSAAALALAVSEAGGASVRTVVLLTAEEVDAAANRSVEYQPPTEWQEARHF